MIKENTQRIHRLFSILLSIVIVIAGICLIVACVDIYRSGDQPFSREAVAVTFKPIAIPVYLCLILTIIGFIWDFISPVSLKKTKNTKQYGLLLNRMHESHDTEACSSSIRDSILAEQKKRKSYRLISTVIISIASVIFLVYACNSSNFDKSDINGSVINAMWILIPCMAVSFICGLSSALAIEKSLKAEIDLVKQAPIINKATENPTDDSAANNKNHSIGFVNRNALIIRIVILVGAIALIAFGYFNDGTADVLTKAINICTECIGLG